MLNEDREHQLGLRQYHREMKQEMIQKYSKYMDHIDVQTISCPKIPRKSNSKLDDFILNSVNTQSSEVIQAARTL